MVGSLRAHFKEIQMYKKKKTTSIKPELVKEDAFDQQFGGSMKRFDKAIKDAGFIMNINSGWNLYPKGVKKTKIF